LAFRVAWRAIRGKQRYKRAKIRKLIFLGLDGARRRLTERYIKAGKLPNLAKLAQQ
jgi:hypothetical protein